VGHLGLEQTDDRLGQCVVIGVTRGAHRTLDTGLCQSLGVTNRQVLAAPDALLFVKQRFLLD
jgi:hypothetical protein